MLGADHPETLLSMNNLALEYSALGRHDEACDLLESAVAIGSETLGDEHPLVAGLTHSLAEVYLDAGDLVAARRYLERAIGSYESLGGNSFLGLALSQLAGVAMQEERPGEVRALLERALAGGWTEARIAADPR